VSGRVAMDGKEERACLCVGWGSVSWFDRIVEGGVLVPIRVRGPHDGVTHIALRTEESFWMVPTQCLCRCSRPEKFAALHGGCGVWLLLCVKLAVGCVK